MKYYIWVFLWAIFVLVLCTMPPGDVPDFDAGKGMDKLAHAGFFFVFCTLLYRALDRTAKGKRSPLANTLWVSTAGVVFALFTEFLQWKVFTYRTAEIGDLYADCVGIGMAIFAYFCLRKSR